MTFRNKNKNKTKQKTQKTKNKNKNKTKQNKTKKKTFGIINKFGIKPVGIKAIRNYDTSNIELSPARNEWRRGGTGEETGKKA